MIDIPVKHTIKEHKEMMNPQEITCTQAVFFQNKYLVVGGWDGAVSVYDTENLNQSVQFYSNLYEMPIQSIVNLNNKLVAVAGHGKVITILDITKPEKVKEITASFDINAMEQVEVEVDNNI